MTRAGLHAVTAGNALVKINMGEIVNNGDSVRGTLSCAFAAAYAAHFAHFHHLCALVLIGAGDNNVLLFGYHGDNALGAGIGTRAAPNAFIAVDLCNAVDYFHSAELAGFYTVAHANAGISAQFIALAAEQHSGAAVLRAGIIEALFRSVLTAGAANVRRHLFHGVRRHAHDLRNFLCGFFSAGNALIGGRFACGNSGGVAVAAGIAASAAVCTGKAGADGFLFGIYFNMENFRGDGKKRAEKAAERAKNEDGIKNFYHFFLLPLRKSSCR